MNRKSYVEEWYRGGISAKMNSYLNNAIIVILNLNTMNIRNIMQVDSS